MRLTVYDLIMSLLWSSLYIVIFCLLRRNYSFIQKHGVFPLIVILLLALFRFFVPIEFPYTKVIYSYNFLTDLQDMLRQSSGLFSLSYGALLMILWASVSVVLASRLLYGIAKQRRMVSNNGEWFQTTTSGFKQRRVVSNNDEWLQSISVLTMGRLRVSWKSCFQRLDIT